MSARIFSPKINTEDEEGEVNLEIARNTADAATPIVEEEYSYYYDDEEAPEEEEYEYYTSYEYSKGKNSDSVDPKAAKKPQWSAFDLFKET